MCITDRNQPENATYCDSNSVTFWKRQNCGDQWLPGVRKESSPVSRTQRMFRAVELFLLIIMHKQEYAVKCAHHSGRGRVDNEGSSACM